MTSSTDGDVASNSPAGVRVLGIDPGTLRMGYGVIDHIGPGRQRYVECGVLSAPASMPREQRLLVIGQELQEVLKELRPQTVAMEQAFVGKNVQSTLALGEARGVATYVVGVHGLNVQGYPPAVIKRAVVGHGRADKGQVGFIIKAMLKLNHAPDEDAADALAIAICHGRELCRPLIDGKGDRKREGDRTGNTPTEKVK